MDVTELYRRFCEHMKSEELACSPWDNLHPRFQIVWGKLFRSLERDKDAEIAALKARVAELEKALEPFAERYIELADDRPSSVMIEVEYLRAAARARGGSK